MDPSRGPTVANILALITPRRGPEDGLAWFDYVGYSDEGSSSRSPSGRVGDRAVAFEQTRQAQAYIMPSRPGRLRSGAGMPPLPDPGRATGPADAGPALKLLFDEDARCQLLLCFCP
jgi:hypothetical protein